jgi:protoporphyrinogen oxidase
MNKHIGIIGGGLLGMTLALRLREQGFEITLLEASERTGGLVKPTYIGDYVWDQFYHVILMSDESLLDLINRLGLTDRLKLTRTKTGFLKDGHLYSMSNIMEFLTFPPLRLLDKIRLGFTILYASKIRSPERMEKILVEDWLKRFSGQRTFNKIWLPLLKSKLGEHYKVTSASFIWASIDRMYKARRTGLKTEMFGYVDGGYAMILDRFQEVLDGLEVQTLCQKPVIQVIDDEANVKVKISTGETLKFDHIIFLGFALNFLRARKSVSKKSSTRMSSVLLS